MLVESGVQSASTSHRGRRCPYRFGTDESQSLAATPTPWCSLRILSKTCAGAPSSFRADVRCLALTTSLKRPNGCGRLNATALAATVSPAVGVAFRLSRTMRTGFRRSYGTAGRIMYPTGRGTERCTGRSTPSSPTPAATDAYVLFVIRNFELLEPCPHGSHIGSSCHQIVLRRDVLTHPSHDSPADGRVSGCRSCCTLLL